MQNYIITGSTHVDLQFLFYLLDSLPIFSLLSSLFNLHWGLFNRTRRDLSVTPIEFQLGKLLSSRKSIAQRHCVRDCPTILARGFSSSKGKLEFSCGIYNDFPPLPPAVRLWAKRTQFSSDLILSRKTHRNVPIYNDNQYRQN